MAARVVAAIVKRGLLPAVFLEEVMKKIQDIGDEGEEISQDHANHQIFTQEVDEQLLLWMNRYCNHDLVSVYCGDQESLTSKTQSGYSQTCVRDCLY